MDIVEGWIIAAAKDKTFAPAQKNLCRAQWQLALAAEAFGRTIGERPFPGGNRVTAGRAVSHQADDERCLLSVSFVEGYVREFWLRPVPLSLPHRTLGANLQHPIETPKGATCRRDTSRPRNQCVISSASCGLGTRRSISAVHSAETTLTPVPPLTSPTLQVMPRA
jgi:hypothetical protein